MALKLVEHAHVADALTGRRHGRVRRVIPGDRFQVEWSDHSKTEHAGDELVARFTSQSKEFGRVF